MSGISDVQSLLYEIDEEEGLITGNMHHGAWITQVLEHCPNLVDLELINPGKIDLDDNSKLRSFLSVKRLTLQNVGSNML